LNQCSSPKFLLSFKDMAETPLNFQKAVFSSDELMWNEIKFGDPLPGKAVLGGLGHHHC
jgi:hypothetical protein